MNNRVDNLKSVIDQQRAKRQRYLDSPNLCLTCNKPIIPRKGEPLTFATAKRFCDRSCAAIHNNRHHPKRVKLADGGPECIKCGNKFVPATPKSIVCRECKNRMSVATKTKGQLFKSRTNWQSARSSIQRHARATYLSSGGPTACCVCGYDKHIDIAHRIAVSNFPDDARVYQINDLNNLAPLCPNHHWEHDHGLLTLSI